MAQAGVPAEQGTEVLSIANHQLRAALSASK